jgi:hypothetical protein
MERISWTDRVRNKEVIRTVNEDRNVLHTIKRRNCNWRVTSSAGIAF